MVASLLYVDEKKIENQYKKKFPGWELKIAEILVDGLKHLRIVDYQEFEDPETDEKIIYEGLSSQKPIWVEFKWNKNSKESLE